jgi:hypothetical protein
MALGVVDEDARLHRLCGALAHTYFFDLFQKKNRQIRY